MERTFRLKENETEDAAFNLERGVPGQKDILAPSSVRILPDHCRIGSKFCKSIAVIGYPRYVEANFLSALYRFEGNIDVAAHIHPAGNKTAINLLTHKISQMESTVLLNKKRGKLQDPEIETALQDAKNLRDSLQRGEEKLFYYSLYITIYGKDLDELSRMTDLLMSMLAGRLLIVKELVFQQEEALRCVYPFGKDQLLLFRNMQTSAVSATFPFTSGELNTNSGILYGIDIHNNSLVIFDRFNLDNANLCVFATSGAGKSYLVKLETLRSLMLGRQVVVIDPEDEYGRLAKAVGGQYINISSQSNHHINPFDIRVKVNGNIDKQFNLTTKILSLHTLLSLMLGSRSAKQKAYLDNALQEIYSGYRNTQKSTKQKLRFNQKVESVTLQDLYNVLDRSPDTREMALMLKPFVSGSFSIFNRQTNVNLNKDLVIFNIRDMEEELRPIAMFIVLEYLWNWVKCNQTVPKTVVIDEAWLLMQYQDTARFLHDMAKRCRKYYCGLSTVTQNVSDFLKGDYGQAIIANSSAQLLFRQSPADISEVSTVFNLSERERAFLLSCKRGEGLFFAGGVHTALRVVASKREHELITTDPRETAGLSEK